MLSRAGPDRPGRDGHGQDGGVRAAAAPPAAPRRRASRQARRRARLILVPTRELAMQVAEAVHKYAQGARRSPSCRSTAARRWISRSAPSSAAPTSSSRRPGARSIIMRRRRSNSTPLEVLVLDEADEMLDMGFAEDLEAILDGDAGRRGRRRCLRRRWRRGSRRSPERHLKQPGADHDQGREARRRQAAARPPGRLHRRARAARPPRSAASSSSRIRPRRSCSAGRASKSTS